MRIILALISKNSHNQQNMYNLDLQISEFFFELGRALPQVLVVFLASYLIWILVLLVIIVSRKRKERPWRLFMQSIFAAVVGYGLNSIIGIIYFRTRPFKAMGFSPLIGSEHLDKSFPSDHTTVAFSLAFMVFLHNKKYGALVLGAASLVAIGRMLAGVHYFSDIASGIVVGAICALVVYLLAKRQREGSWFKFFFLSI